MDLYSSHITTKWKKWTGLLSILTIVHHAENSFLRETILFKSKFIKPIFHISVGWILDRFPAWNKRWLFSPWCALVALLMIPIFGIFWLPADRILSQKIPQWRGTHYLVGGPAIFGNNFCCHFITTCRRREKPISRSICHCFCHKG